MAQFSLMQKTLNLEQIEGKYSAFAKCHYALPVRMSKPLAKDGCGKVYVDGIEISQGKTFFMDTILKMHCMLIRVEIVRAGTDWLTEGGSRYVKILKKAVKNGTLSVEILRDNAKYVVAWVLKTQEGSK